MRTLSGPDWAGVVMHYPGNRLIVVQLARPLGHISIDTEALDVSVASDGFRTEMPVRQWAEVELRGQVIDAAQTYGDRPDWARVQRAIAASARAIEAGGQ